MTARRALVDGGGWRPSTRRTLVAAGAIGLIVGLVVMTRSPAIEPTSATVVNGGATPARGEVGAGSTTYIARMPAGFERSEAGAASAGVAFAADAEQQMLYLDDDGIEHAQRQISASAATDRLLEERTDHIAEWRRVVETGTGQLWWIVTPLASKVDQFTADEATVEVWVAYVVSRQGATTPRVWFGLVSLDLVWERDDWRVAAQSMADGPSPQLSPTAAPASADELATRLDGFHLVRGDR